MKKLGFLLMLVVLLWALPGIGQASAASNSIFLDGQELEQPEGAQAGLVNGSVMVPIRVISEGLGYEVGWEKQNGTVSIKQGDRSLQLFIDNEKAIVDGSDITLSSPPLLKEDTTLVPLRFVGEQMGLQVSWDNETKSAHLYSTSSGSDSGVVNSGASTPPVNEGEAVPGEDQPVEQPETNGASGSESTTANNPSSNLATISGFSFSDNRLMILTDRTVEPNVFKMSDPDRVVIDVPNAKFSDGFKDILPLDETNRGQFTVEGYPEVSQIRYSLFSNDPSTIRLVIDLNESREFVVSKENDLTIVELTLEPVVHYIPTRPDGKSLVVIDAGHGGTDPGAPSVSGGSEKDVNLAIALRVNELLQHEPDIITVLTRSDDTYPTLDERVMMANDLLADIFISIHANSGSATASGTETLYTRDASILLADTVHKYVLEATGLTDRKVKNQNLKVTRETMMPAILLETGFLSNPHDDAVLKDPVVQERIAAGIVAGIKEYLGLQ
ncbi:N-acetylmuramoyl-L-alanine amidase family protein [Paenibacillus lentus]|nr:N-acetylmuramoyl-L-alanine amidase family protein [Paenibacillus lentus]